VWHAKRNSNSRKTTAIGTEALSNVIESDQNLGDFDAAGGTKAFKLGMVMTPMKEPFEVRR
jgi:hypothetical protein